MSRSTARVLEAGAVATTSAFAGGALLSQTVVVPTWRAMDPAVFLHQFGTSGPATGATVFPFELASVVLLGVTTYRTVKRRRPGGLVWALATASMVGTLLLVPIYFWHANTAMLDPDFPPEAVPAALTAWNAWNWARTGLGLAAAALALAAHAAGATSSTPGPSAEVRTGPPPAAGSR
jgi:hypothetical protein